MDELMSKYLVFSRINLRQTLKYALKIYEKKEQWDKLVKNAMERKSSWANAAKQYKKIYKALIDKK